MDISVSRLNNRMVLQVPPELPLGLVFVVGQVRNLIDSRDHEQSMQFDLMESGYCLRCQLSSRVANDVVVAEGDMVRAGGHLAFDTQAARYFLLARDLEIVPDQAGMHIRAVPILADIDQRAEAADLVRTDLPQWVKHLAPPEIQAELGLVEDEKGKDQLPAATDILAPGTDLLAPGAGMSDEMVSFLSEAIDRNEDVEITPEVLSQFLPLPTVQDVLDQTPAGQETRDPSPPAPTELAPPGQPEAPPTDRPPIKTTQPLADQLPADQPLPVAPPLAAPPRKRQNNAAQNLLLVMIGALLLILIVIISVLLLDYLQII